MKKLLIACLMGLALVAIPSPPANAETTEVNCENVEAELGLSAEDLKLAFEATLALYGEEVTAAEVLANLGLDLGVDGNTVVATITITDDGFILDMLLDIGDPFGILGEDIHAEFTIDSEGTLCGDVDLKVTICHVPPGNPANAHEIEVSVNAQGHFKDHEGEGHSLDFVVDADHPCPPVDPDPDPEPDPLVRVCINGAVETVLTSVQVELGLTVLGDDEGCPVTTTTTAPPVIIEVPKIVEKVVEVPGPTQVVEVTRTITQPAPAAPAAPAPAGELPRTGAGNLLTLIGTGLAGTGLILRRLFRK